MIKKIIKVSLVIIAVLALWIGFEMSRSVDSVFPKQEEAFGIKIYATRSVSDENIKHAKAVLSEYIDNDEDGKPDNPKVLEVLIKEEAGIMMTGNFLESMKIFVINVRTQSTTSNLQELYNMEVHPNGQAENKFDGTLEEVLHLITHVGYARAYPEVWGEEPGSEIANIMDKARGGHFIQVPAKYPESAWYSYYDETADYGTMVTEYIYWSLTSILGAQSYEGRLEKIQNEYKLNTKEKVMATDPQVYELLTNPIYKLPKVLPDGKYLGR